MNFDTGATEMSLTTDALTKKVKSNPELYSRLLDIKLGKRTYQSKVYDTQVVGHEADGLLGWDIFDGMVVELNYDKKLMAIHSRMPDSIINNPKTSRFKIKYINNKPFIGGFIFHNKQAYKNWFLFDTGYQRTAMLDNDLLKKDKFPTEKMEVIKKVIMRGTQNNEIPVVTAKLQKIKLGKSVLENIPAQLLGSAKPMPGINIHILGSDILKRFNTYIDLQKDLIYLMPNQLYGMNYADENKS
ncbi:MAG: clan AA aspartic protease [Pedobacter sp.]|nr:MAG: clan AA aspartic protease [Pedobacter sp.]